MNSQITNPERPTLVNVIAWMTLASGVVNLFWGLGLALTGLLSIIGIFCVPFLILPTILGIFEIIYAARLLSSQPQATEPSTTVAILEILCVIVGNVFSVVVGILALVFYNDVTVREYFARLNSAIVPVTPVVDLPTAPPAAPAPFEPIAPAPQDIPPAPEPPFSDENPPRS